MGQYDAIATRVVATITKKGAPVMFVAGPWSAQPTTDAIGVAIQDIDNPETIARVTGGAVVTNPVTLLIAAKSLPAAFRPTASMRLRWAGEEFTVRGAEAVAPQGESSAILWTVVASQ